METDQERLAERFAHVAAIADDVRPADRAILVRLPREQLLQQHDARRLLRDHMHYLWEAAKADGLDPATDPAWMSLAMLCDLTADLLHTAATAHPSWVRTVLPQGPAWVMPPAGHAPPPATDW